MMGLISKINKTNAKILQYESRGFESGAWVAPALYTLMPQWALAGGSANYRAYAMRANWDKGACVRIRGVGYPKVRKNLRWLVHRR